MNTTTHKQLKIEVRHTPHQEWFKVGTLENISFEDAKKFIKDVQESNPSQKESEYRIIEC